MKPFSSILLTCLSLFGFAQEKQSPTYHSFFHSDVVDYKSYFGRTCHTPKGTHHFTVNLLAGLAKNEYGLLIATLWNEVDNNAYGLQISGLYNYIKDQGKGLAIAGYCNNYKFHAGMQIGVYNYAEKMRGLQIGFDNSSVDMQGLQIGMLNNYPESTALKGAQVGLFNIGNSPVQIGLCNISDHNPYPLGLVNLIKNGQMSAGLAYDELGNIKAQFYSGGEYLYGLVGFGNSLKSQDGHLLFEGGIGVSFKLSPGLRLNPEISAKQLTRVLMTTGGDTEENRGRRNSSITSSLPHSRLAFFLR
jgi:hypothetical protein